MGAGELGKGAMLTHIEKVLLLQDLDLFSLVSTEHLSHLAALCAEMEAEANSVLFKQGDPCLKLHLLVEGRVSLQDGVGASVLVEKCGLDFWSFFAHQPHLFTARCLEKCTVLSVAFEDLGDLLTAEPEFCWAILRYLAQLGRNRPAADFADPAPGGSRGQSAS